MAQQTINIGDTGSQLVSKLANNFGELYMYSAAYSVNVPFNKGCTICEHTLTANDTLVPSALVTPVPSCGAIYRLIGDGTHIPIFTGFNQSNGSFSYDETIGVVNIVIFLYDGFEYWYTINQAI
jgi:hypothetical protein